MLFFPIYEEIEKIVCQIRYPVLGKMIDIGGRRIQLDCRGFGAPTVVFESGLDFNGSLSWARVHDQIAQVTRACAYSRAGILWSDPRKGPTSGKEIAADLHLALSHAGESSPFIMVGHSAGGIYNLIYSKYFPTDVASLVFIDASHPNQLNRFPTETLPSETQWFQEYQLLAGKLSWTGMARVLILPILAASPRQRWRLSHRPSEISHMVEAYAPVSIQAVNAETVSFPKNLAEAGTVYISKRLPIYVISGLQPIPPHVLSYLSWSDAQAKQYLRIWEELQREEAGWSDVSEYHMASDATHYVQFDRPDLVTAIVLSAVERVRGFP